MKSITANLIVPSIEACLPFYVDRLGFTKTASVPHGDKLGFVILARDSVQLMLQSLASLADDVAGLGDNFRAVLYIDVPDLTPFRAALANHPTVVPERTTDYGARELIVKDPAGNAVFLSSRATDVT